MDATKKYESVDEYISVQEKEIQSVLNRIRNIIKKTVPSASETISYGMPAYKQHGILCYFAANKHHVGFYPTGSPIEVFKDELISYKTSKGAIQFPYNEELPEDLIKKIIEYRVNEDELKYLNKKKK